MAEQLTVNQLVVGSIPTLGAIQKERIMEETFYINIERTQFRAGMSWYPLFSSISSSDFNSDKIIRMVQLIKNEACIEVSWGSGTFSSNIDHPQTTFAFMPHNVEILLRAWPKHLLSNHYHPGAIHRHCTVKDFNYIYNTLLEKLPRENNVTFGEL